MKNSIFFLLLIPLLIVVSCDSDSEQDDLYADYLVAKPVLMTAEEFRNSLAITAPQPVEKSGKIYAYQDLIFVNDQFKGVHVIDNSDPRNPSKVAFIEIAGNVDISVKGDYLYADSITDLVVLDISDITNIRIVTRMENVFPDYWVWPLEADIIEFGEVDYGAGVLVGWELVTERRLIAEVEQQQIDILMQEAASDAQTGQGGSLARFKIVGDFLYAVDSHQINVFDIADLENPRDLEDVFAGFDIETIYNRGNHLFLGSMRGMYIYDISSPATPTFVSEFQHGTACDPVVVDNQYAYITLRGGNNCGALESGLFIVDITSISEPALVTSYSMDDPYGLGIKDNKIFVCDGSSGLKVYDKTDVENLVMLNHFKDIVTYDVIPLTDVLLMVGEEVLYQYQYLESDIELLSSLAL